MFVRTESNEALEVYNANEVSVKPSGNAQWVLFLDCEEDEANIGIFDDVDQANDALTSLRRAIEVNLGWDFNQYRKASREEE
ncbi:MAG: hypothetical protein OXN27_23040 [Candidatus Poribacteria bacterium]|nr:hypothetical protein [Candidatus Poribacteria bacterium]